ncbi:2-amino-4-hydroxy-6-hydroxymethyldihydropteridine diphosphokinase [Pseudohongiella acticola]|uniref:2-amino-4-hydroxy-6-hydroxymethyldihydropteridine pyrophosphokinase n=1 Tax=Pseudohongiella acticola TaxID=1524254 RepID=A0A1E8CMW5_9GAMM|nr:2-amino-4-hydroxy-6-hydroxymethyldihydropteridine diphosphokinase [Pseudohongiella acticola]OFE13645.1 2-amino-4-hydroxy-6-hydroxymethyldihydropteridine diphosphokinase [Pseudohongiella acticola]
MSSQLSTTAELIARHSGGGLSAERLAIVSLGANLPSRFGSPRATLEQAADKLTALSVWPVVLSPIVQTAPIDCPPESPEFFNAVAVLDPGKETSPLQFLRTLQAIETYFGRARTGQINEPRVLDLDLICYGQHRCKSSELTLPHPRAAQRDFVLKPLAVIWPSFELPAS